MTDPNLNSESKVHSISNFSELTNFNEYSNANLHSSFFSNSEYKFNDGCPICKFHSDVKSKNLEMLRSILFISDNWMLRSAEKEKSCRGYLYLEPIGHYESFHSISSTAYTEFGGILEKGMKWIEENFHPKKIYTVTISEMVPHIHFHLVPRYTDEIKGLDYLKLALSGDLKNLER